MAGPGVLAGLMADDPPRVVPGHGLPRDEVNVEGLRVVEVIHAPGLCLGSHSHSTAKLCIVLDGAVSEQCGYDVLSPAPLDPVFRTAEVLHANQYHARGARSLLVEIEPDDARARVRTNGLAGDRAAARAHAACLVAAFAARRSSRARLVRAALRSLLDSFAVDRARYPTWLDAAREALATQAAAPPPLRELAARIGVHPVHLARAFHARFGTTTRAFVRAHRVFRALELVAAGTPLAAAAATAGFTDQSHMTRAIRAARGAPPGALRRGR